MKTSEFKKLIREEVKTLLREATYPISIQEIKIDETDHLIIIIGNSRADLIGFEPTPEQLSKLDAIMKQLDSSAKRVPGPQGVQFTEGQLRYQLMYGASIYPDKFIKAVQQVEALGMKHNY